MIGKQVSTPLGQGTVVGKDIPAFRSWRWLVMIDIPAKNWSHWEGKTACFYTNEITKI